MRATRTFLAAGSLLALAACGGTPIETPPVPTATTDTARQLIDLPAPQQQIPVAVYAYPDRTGQFKFSDTVALNSRAVTQGAETILIEALKETGAGNWFQVVERAGLQNLLTERQIIRETRANFLDDNGQPLPPPPPLLFAGVILEGGIIGYDTNTLTGGAGARYFGIGGNVEYREDTVTVFLRAISTQSGEVLKSVSTKKRVLSLGAQGSIFRFIEFQRLLEVEAGITTNEPGVFALKKAIEQAVYQLVVEGAADGIWAFLDGEQGAAIIKEYEAELGALEASEEVL